MSSTDKRIVELSFENRQFEKGVQESLSSIQRLNNGLNFSGAENGFQRLNNAIDTTKVNFSTMDLAFGTAIVNLVNTAIDAGKKVASALWDPIVSGGKRRALNIEQAKFQFEGLGIDVEEAMANANEAVSGTAYGLDAAAKAAAQLAASGIKPGEELTKILRAIAGVAAMTGSEYEDISRIFISVSGNGRVMGEQLLQLSSRGLNAAATMAKYLGITEEALRAIISNPKTNVDFETFYKAMDQAFGEHAKDANKTFAGSLSNVKAALSRIGAEFATPSYQNFRDIFNSLIPVINNVKAGMAPFIGTFTKLTTSIKNASVTILDNFNVEPISKFFNIIANLAEIIYSVLAPIGRAFLDVFGHDTTSAIGALLGAIDSLTKMLILNEDIMSIIYDVFKLLFTLLKVGVTIMNSVVIAGGKLVSVVTPFSKILQSIVGLVARLIPNLTFLDYTVSGLDTAVRGVSDGMNWLAEKTEAAADAVSSFLDAIDIQKIIDFAVSIKDKFVSGIQSLLSNVSFFKTFTKTSEESTQSMGNSIKRSANALVGYAETTSASFAKMKIAAKDSSESVQKSLSPVSDKFEKLRKVAAFVLEKIKALKSAIWSKLAPLLNAIWDMIVRTFETNTLDSLFSTFVEGGIGLGIANLLKTFNSTVKNMNGSLNNVRGIVASIKGVLNEAKNALKAWQKDIKANMLWKIAKSVAVLTVALIALTFIDIDKLKVSLATISIALGELIAGMALISKIDVKNVKSLDVVRRTLLKVAIAILILSFAVKNLSGLSWEELAKGLGAIVVLFIALAAYAKSLSNAQYSRNLSKLSGNLIALAIAMNLLAFAVKTLGSMDLWDLVKGAGVLVGLMYAFSGAIDMVGKSGGKLTKNKNVLVMAAMLYTITRSVVTLSKIPVDALAAGTTSIMALLGVLIAFVAVSKNANGTSMMQVGLGLMEVSVALKIITGALKSLAKIAPESLIVGIIALSVALAAMSASLILISRLGGNATELLAIGGALAIMAVGIRILAPALERLGNLNIGQIITALITLVATLGIFFVAAKMFNSVGKEMFIFSMNLAIFAVALNLLGTGLILMGVGAATFFGAMSTILIGLELLFTKLTVLAPLLVGAISAFVTSLLLAISGISALLASTIITVIKAALTALLGSATTIGESMFQFVLKILDVLNKYGPAIVNKLLTFIINLLDVLIARMPELVNKGTELFKALLTSIFGTVGDGSAIDTMGLQGVITSLGTILLAMIIVGNNAKKALKGLLVLAATMGLLWAFLAALSLLDLGNTLETLAGLSAVIISLGALTALFSVISIDPASAGIGMAGFAVVLAGLTAILALMGGLKQIPGIEWIISEGAEFMAQIGDAIGGFFGAIVGGFIGNMSSAFPKIGENLSLFMENLSGFIEGAKNINEDVLLGVLSLAGAILAITAVNLIENMTRFMLGGRDFVSFSKELIPFGENLKTFSDTIKDMDTDAVEASASAAMMIAKMYNTLPSKGGLKQLLLGAPSLTKFAEELINFGPAIRFYGLSVRGLDTEAIRASAAAAEIMATLEKNLPKHGGVLQWITGDATLETFGEALVSFGPHIKEYGDTVKGLNTAAVTASAAAAQIMSTIEKNLPKHGGVKSWITGDATLETFGKALASFGPHIKQFGEDVFGLKVGSVAAASIAAQMLSELEANLPKHGGFISLFTGDNDLGKFSKSLPAFGKNIKKMADELGETAISKSVVEAAAAAAQMLAELQNNLPPEHGILQMWLGETQSLSSFSRHLPKFGKNLKAFAEEIGVDFPEANVKAAASAAGGLAEVIKSVAPAVQVSGWKVLVEGVADFNKFIRAIGGDENNPGLGSAIAAFSADIGELTTEDINKISAVAPAIDVLAGASNKIGILTDSFRKGLEGCPDIIAFAGAIGGIDPETGEYTNMSLGKALARFGRYVKLINVDDVKIASDAIDILAEASSKIEKTGSIFDAITGVTDYVKFIDALGGGTDEEGNKTPGLGQALKNFGSAMTDVNMDAVDRGVSALSTIIDALNTLPLEGGFIQIFTGNAANFVTLAENLTLMGELLIGRRGYHNGAYTFIGFFAHAVDVAQLDLAISNFNKVMAVLKDVADFKFYGTEHENFVLAISNLSSLSIQGFIDNFKNAEEKGGQAVQSWIHKTLASVIKARKKVVDSGKKIVVAFYEGVSDPVETNKVVNIGRILTAKIAQNAIAFGDRMTSSASSLLSMFMGGFTNEDAIATIKRELEKIQSAITNTISRWRPKFESAGSNLSEAFSSGISANSASVQRAAEKIAAAADKSIRKRLDIHSPSGVGLDLGEYFGIAVAMGIDSTKNSVQNAAMDLADSSEGPLRMALQALQRASSEDFDISPRVVPVVDLNSVYSNRKAYEAMLSKDERYIRGAYNSVQTINEQYDLSARFDTLPIVSKLQELQEEVGALQDHMDDMAIYLDDDKMVGSLSSKIDSALGKRLKYAKRG